MKRHLRRIQGAETGRAIVAMAAGITLGGAALWSGAALASNAVNAEAVDDFGGSSIICIAEADNYRNTLINASGTFFTAGQRFTNGSVWDTDLADPNSSGNPADNDTTYFDHAGSFSSYFCGHGECNDDPAFNSGLGKQSCTASSQCHSPPGGGSGQGACVSNGPKKSGGLCFYPSTKHMIMHGSQSHHGNYLDYTGNLVRWGESPNSGTWGGAGTNGGQNFAILSNSCGLRPNFWFQEIAPLFAGIHQLGIIMPITSGSDDVDAPDRGTFVAQGFTSNHFSSVGLSFIDAINSMSQSDGGPCPRGASDYSLGGGHGVGGCGAQVIASVDASASLTNWHTLNESWAGATFDSNDATGGGYLSVYLVCNYDCNTYPMVL